MSTPGEILVRTLASVYTYSAPQRRPPTGPYAPPLPPTLNHLPAFVRLARGLDDRLITSLSHTFTSHIESHSIRADAIEKMCRNADSDPEPSFSSMQIGTTKGGGVTAVTNCLVREVSGITFKGYGCSIDNQVETPGPYHVLSYNGTRRAVWEDEGYHVFDQCAVEGRLRVMLYKMVDCQVWWGILFGGDRFILFQRVADSEYGLLCSDILPIDRLCLITLGMILCPPLSPNDNEDQTAYLGRRLMRTSSVTAFASRMGCLDARKRPISVLRTPAASGWIALHRPSSSSVYAFPR